MARYSGRTLIATTYGVALLTAVVVSALWAHDSLLTAPPARPSAVAVQPAGVLPPSLPAQARGWLRQGQSAIHDLFVAGDYAVIDASEKNVAGAGVACQSASAAAARLQEHLPSPDSSANLLLQEAIGDYRAGIHRCLSGAHDNDAARLDRSMIDIKRGGAELQDAIEILIADEHIESPDHHRLTV
ncbi:hypothetical protein [Mycobacterium paraterrae]|uniref:DUF732 domain-containing protein n=1 Tax=Mycobacterium paraterrae TaxID=577492 RepID=A0ABY3VKQ6_9MYCO|nr:hypothetical protein [Mycobacterium paraterrae]UMB68750.1 hypothetical protein MKK62_20450 [Mycobacterium paraterrae]